MKRCLFAGDVVAAADVVAVTDVVAVAAVAVVDAAVLALVVVPAPAPAPVHAAVLVSSHVLSLAISMMTRRYPFEAPARILTGQELCFSGWNVRQRVLHKLSMSTLVANGVTYIVRGRRMAKLNPSMRIKVKRDTVYIPDSDGSVYFRNNIGTFRMKGDMIDRWVDQLMPMFNGVHTLAELTDDLPEEYQHQIYLVADTLMQNGFLQDVSRDRSHDLSKEVMEQYAAQIEFLDQFGGSGDYQFEKYRTEKVLVVGAGGFLLSVIHSLLESGCVQFHYAMTNETTTNRERLATIIEHARKKDPHLELGELSPAAWGIAEWTKAIEPFSAILYTTANANMDEVNVIHAACKEGKKVFIPAMFVLQKGMVGPLSYSESEACFESAWRRVHRLALSEDPNQHTYSMTAAAMLANIAVFEWFKYVTGVNEAESPHKIYLLNLETLEGSWQSFKPHPMIGEGIRMEVLDAKMQETLLTEEAGDKEGLLSVFPEWTSADTGIFHTWEEGNHTQLPLSQCVVTAVDLVSDGPAELLPSVVCAGYTHDDARREAGLLGAEMYVASMVSYLAKNAAFPAGAADCIGIGAGETAAEGLCRALRHCLTLTYVSEMKGRQPAARPLLLDSYSDERTQYYLRTIASLEENPTVAKGYDVCGFPVYWVGTRTGWYGSAGLLELDALQNALMHALHRIQTPSSELSKFVLNARSVALTGEAIRLPHIQDAGLTDRARWQEAVERLARHHQYPLVINAAIEPFLKEDLGGVFAISLSREVLP